MYVNVNQTHLLFKIKMMVIRAAIITPARDDIIDIMTAATTEPDVCL